MPNNFYYKKARPQRLYYHFVFHTKYNQPVITEKIALGLKKVFVAIAKQWKYRLFHMGINKDHVHLLVGFSPKIAPLKAIKNFKGAGTRFILERYPHLITHMGKSVLWQKGYAVYTVGVPFVVLKRYLDKPKNQMDKASFLFKNIRIK